MRKRMKTVRGLWAGLLAAAVVLTSAAPSALTVQAEEADAVQTAEVSGVEYQIYPTPHEMTYQDGGFDIGEVNIVYENGVDDVTKNRMTEVLSIKGKSESAAVTNAKVDGKTNILAGMHPVAHGVRLRAAVQCGRKGRPGPGGALPPYLLRRTRRLPEKLSALPGGHQAHRGRSDRGRLTGRGHR